MTMPSDPETDFCQFFFSCYTIMCRTLKVHYLLGQRPGLVSDDLSAVGCNTTLLGSPEPADLQTAARGPSHGRGCVRGGSAGQDGEDNQLLCRGTRHLLHKSEPSTHLHQFNYLLNQGLCFMSSSSGFELISF